MFHPFVNLAMGMWLCTMWLCSLGLDVPYLSIVDSAVRTQSCWHYIPSAACSSPVGDGREGAITVWHANTIVPAPQLIINVQIYIIQYE